ncbi:MAG: KOW domain-containing RNA-binding protein [Ruminococcus sp.]|nr:KOW domain-containing RNA-binding protein [Ruminococcus sp.]MCM1381174.1 KOW domain-containing RNA-binding protein [Muribaculaceae bacterium]MCM1478198.1 KOW domain-containing RNA-binding protein [Muribaculaceae bacterium]
MEVTRGMIVKSKAGHDKGRFMVITALEGDFAFLADGKERKLEKPKKKRLKHLAATKTVIAMSNLTDKGLRRRLREFAEKGSPETENS